MVQESQREYASDEGNKDGEYIKVGGSPVPGITLRAVLRGHTNIINRMAWSPDGRYLASPASDKTIRIWDVQNVECTAVLEGHNEQVNCVAWSHDGQQLASGSNDGGVQLWSTNTWKTIIRLKHYSKVCSVGWSPDGSKLMSGAENKGINIWNVQPWKTALAFNLRGVSFQSSRWSPDGQKIAAVGYGIITIFDALNGTELISFEDQKIGMVWDVAWLPDSNTVAFGSSDNLVRILSLERQGLTDSIEGHKNFVQCVEFSSDGQLLASKSQDGSIRLYSVNNWKTLAILSEATANKIYRSLAFQPRSARLATLGMNDTGIRIWDIDYTVLLNRATINNSIRYTTAKLILVGDSGVGKTGLGWRLAHNEFKEHSSTHGQQFWVIPELGKKREDGTECEAVLWDLAGQHVYRPIHSIFLDNVDASLVLFDPTNRQDPLKGAQFWLEQLKGKTELPPSVLVGARQDRGAPVLSQQELEQFCQQYGISGGYIGTSAKKGDGLPELLKILKEQIPWDQMTTTVTTVTFKRIKDYVLALKEKPDRKGILVDPTELRKQLQVSDKNWKFTDAEMMTAVGHLENHGYVSILKSSAGEDHILLAPDLLVDLASSIVLLADKHAKELGAVNETELLQGKYKFDELKGLEKDEELILLDAAVLRFLEHNICFRETLGSDTLLIFPGLIKQKRPLQDNFESVDDVSFIVRGRVENIYASLVVLLGYTTLFTRINQWQNQAQYEMGENEICGFRLIEEREGELELVLYYSTTMPPYGRTMFQGLFESFLYNREVDVTRFPPVFCPRNHRIERTAVVKRVREGKNFIFCDECGDRTIIPEIEKPSRFDIKESQQIRRSEAIAQLRSTYETYLLRIKGFRRDRSAPRCYVSCVEEDTSWTEKLKHDLRDAGVQIIEDRKNVIDSDVILFVDTLEYRDHPIESDMALGKARADSGRSSSMYRLRIQKEPLSDITSEPQVGDLRPESRYAVGLFDLLLRLYAIPLDHPAFKQLRESLKQQWEQTLARMGSKKEIYISYAWGGESEKMVDDLDRAFQDRGVTIVHDKRDLGFKGRIKDFMEKIGKGKAVILVISEIYLKSENCMSELLQVAKHGEFVDRVFPIVLEDARIYKAIDRIRYVEYWEKQLKELDKAMKGVSAAHMDGFREDIDLYDEIRDNLPRLSDILKDMNALTPDLHRESGFSEIFDAVMTKLEE